MISRVLSGAVISRKDINFRACKNAFIHNYIHNATDFDIGTAKYCSCTLSSKYKNNQVNE